MRKILTHRLTDADLAAELGDGMTAQAIADLADQMLAEGKIDAAGVYRAAEAHAFDIPQALAIVQAIQPRSVVKVTTVWLRRQEALAQERLAADCLEANRAGKALRETKTNGIRPMLDRLLADADFLLAVHNCHTQTPDTGIRTWRDNCVLIGTSLPGIVDVAMRNRMRTIDLSQALQSIPGAYTPGVKRFGLVVSRTVAVPLSAFPPAPRIPTPEEDPVYYMDAEEF